MQQNNPPINVTTEEIQKYLDLNKQLIMAILENQSQGKLIDCAPYQMQLQNNLTYLAKIADAQPQVPTTHSQILMESAIQHEHNMQAPQQQGFFAPRLPFQLNDEMSSRPCSTTGVYQTIETGIGSNFVHTSGSKQDYSEGVGKLAPGINGGDSEA